MDVEVKKAANRDELGSTGLKRFGGTVNEEFLPPLSSWDRACKVYTEMRDNDPSIGAILYAVEMLIRNVTWRVESEDEELAEFVESCIGDMSHSWEDLIVEILSMLPYGFSWHEIVYKKRNGPSNNPTSNSRFSDGRYGWRKIPIRAQASLDEWIFDEEGGIQAFVQNAPPLYVRIEIPIERSLLFRTGIHKGNPEGRSILRNAYRPWYFKRRIEEIEAIGIERDLAGLPVIYRSGEVDRLYGDELKKIVRNVRRDEQEGVLLPLMYDENGRELCRFELMASAGTRQLDVSATIDRYDKRIAMTVLADFILLGQQAVGSFALASSKTAIFSAALGGFLKLIAAVFNRHAIPRLLAINNLLGRAEVELVPGDVETVDLAELGAYITALAGAGMPLFPNDELENFLLRAANLPPKPEGEGALELPAASPPVPPAPTAPPPAQPPALPEPPAEEEEEEALPS